MPAILDALRRGKIECRIYDRAKFHAKAYITHARLEVVGAQALVGSSNFTRPGLTQNVELNVQVQSAREVAQLGSGSKRTGTKRATPPIPSSRRSRATPATTRRSRCTRGRCRSSFAAMSSPPPNGTRRIRGCSAASTAISREAYWALMKIARRHGGAFLCDGVGLGRPSSG